jgi:hypothetical protein
VEERFKDGKVVIVGSGMQEDGQGTKEGQEGPEEIEGFGGREISAPEQRGLAGKETATDKPKWWPSCIHRRWIKLDKTKFKERIVWLKECRACGKKKVEVVFRDLNSRQVYTGRDVFAVDYKGGGPEKTGG